MLPQRMLTLHIGGVFRGLGSSLDCLAALIIGVLGIPLNLIRADFGKSRRWLSRNHKPNDPRDQVHDDFSAALEAAIDAAGPQGWVEWIDGYRNMLVHRARRLETVVLQAEAHVVDAQGRPIPRATPIPVLMREPSLSDVEALRRGGLYLTEDGRNTLTAAIESVVFVARDVAARLLEVWRTRRTQPELLQQPASQWPAIPQQQPDNFTGYEPGTVEFETDRIMTAPEWVKRLRAAALTSDREHEWEGF